MGNDILLELNENKHKSFKLSKLNIIICYLFIIDILFFPYIRILSASFSMLLLPIWYILNINNIKVTREFKLFLLFLFFSTTSLMFSFINYPEYIKLNIIYFIIIIYGFLYYFFFSFCFENKDFKLKKILIFYITFGFFLSIIYHINTSLFFQIRTFWTMNGNVIEVKDSLLIHRFTSTYSDPNNAAVSFIAVYAFLIFNIKLNQREFIYLSLATIFITVSTMSSTGFVLLGFVFLLVIINYMTRKKTYRIKSINSLLIKIIIFLFCLPLIYYAINRFLSSDVVETALYRISINSTNSRFKIWGTLLSSENIFKYIIFGKGGTILLNKVPFKPHNGHLYLIYNYGILAYLIFIYIFFRIRKLSLLKKYSFLFVFFMGFTMNVGIYEPRFINLLSLLVSAYSCCVNRMYSNDIQNN